MRLLISVLAGVLLAVALAYAQQVNSWTIGNFSVNVPPANPVVTVQSPNRSGTLALREDIVAGPSQTPRAKGIITLGSGVGSATLTGFTVIPVCVVSDPSGNSVRYTNSLTALTVSGVGPSVHFHCE